MLKVSICVAKSIGDPSSSIKPVLSSGSVTTGDSRHCLLFVLEKAFRSSIDRSNVTYVARQPDANHPPHSVSSPDTGA